MPTRRIEFRERELFDRLDRSSHLIVLASPEAAKSQGMEIEAQHWFSRKRDGQVLIIVTDGNSENWPHIREQLLPRSVANNLQGAPVWASLTGRRSTILHDPRGQRVRGEVIEDLKQVLLTFFPGHD